jgi:hypothetical protein
MNEMNEKHLSLLKAIANDKFSIGAFSGMIFNDISQTDNWTNEAIDQKIKLALDIRIRISELTK